MLKQRGLGLIAEVEAVVEEEAAVQLTPKQQAEADKVIEILETVKEEYVEHLQEGIGDTVLGSYEPIEGEDEEEVAAYVEGVVNGTNQEALGTGIETHKDWKPKRIKQGHDGWDKIKNSVTNPKHSKWTNEATSHMRGGLQWKDHTAHDSETLLKVGCSSEHPLSAMCVVGHEMWVAHGQRIKVVHVDSGELLYTMDVPQAHHVDPPLCLQPVNLMGKKHVWVGTEAGLIYVYDVERRNTRKPIQRHAGGILCMICTGHRVFSGSRDFTIIEWELGGKYLRQFNGHFGAIRDMFVLGPQLWSCSDDGTVKIWMHMTGQCVNELTGHDGPVRSLCNTGHDVWSGGEDGTIRRYSHQTEEVLCTHILEAGVGPILRMQKVGRFVWSISSNQVVHMWDQTTMQLHKSASGSDAPVSQMFLVKHAESRMVFTTSNVDGSIEKWVDIHQGGDVHAAAEGRCFEAEVGVLDQQKGNLVTALKRNVSMLWELQRQHASQTCRFQESVAHLTSELSTAKVEHREMREQNRTFRRIDAERVKALNAAEAEKRHAIQRNLMVDEDFLAREIQAAEERSDRYREQAFYQGKLAKQAQSIQDLQEEVEMAMNAVKQVEEDMAAVQNFRDSIHALEDKCRLLEADKLEMKLQLLSSQDEFDKETDLARALRLQLEEMEESALLHDDTVMNMEKEKQLILKERFLFEVEKKQAVARMRELEYEHELLQKRYDASKGKEDQDKLEAQKHAREALASANHNSTLTQSLFQQRDKTKKENEILSQKLATRERELLASREREAELKRLLYGGDGDQNGYHDIECDGVMRELGGIENTLSHHMGNIANWLREGEKGTGFPMNPGEMLRQSLDGCRDVQALLVKSINTVGDRDLVRSIGIHSRASRGKATGALSRASNSPMLAAGTRTYGSVTERGGVECARRRPNTASANRSPWSKANAPPGKPPATARGGSARPVRPP